MATPQFSAHALALRASTVPQVTYEPTEVMAFATRTGRVITSVPFVGVPRWGNGVNQFGTWQATLALRGSAVSAGLTPADLDGLAVPWRVSYAIVSGTKIWEAGPLISEQYQRNASSTTLTGGGLWKFLTDKRLLVNPGRASLGKVTGTDADTVFGPTGYTPVIGGTVPAGNRDLSLGTIAARIVQGIELAAGGDLPIVYPADVAGTAIREYPGYDLASPGQRLSDLSAVDQGPEIQFQPEFVDPLTRGFIQWRMRIGTPNLGTLTFPHAWDSGRALVDVDFGIDGTVMATRDFERGNGMNRDLIVGFADNPIPSGDPEALLIEDVGGAHTSATDVNTLNAWATASVAAGGLPVPGLSAIVRTAGDDGNGNLTRSPHQAGVFAGDTGVLHLRRHPRYQDGDYMVRVIGRGNGDTVQEIALTLQLLGRTLR